MHDSSINLAPRARLIAAAWFFISVRLMVMPEYFLESSVVT